jgi:hypothetical protein
MYKETVNYIDYNGEQGTETFYFNFSKAELMEMELTMEGGLVETIDRITKTSNKAALITLFKDLVLKAYGVKSPDGKRFIKNDEVRAEFEQHPAFSDIFVKYATDNVAAEKFVKGIIPADLNAPDKTIAPAAL